MQIYLLPLELLHMQFTFLTFLNTEWEIPKKYVEMHMYDLQFLLFLAPLALALFAPG